MEDGARECLNETACLRLITFADTSCMLNVGGGRAAAEAWEAAFVELAHSNLSDVAAAAGLRLSFSAERSVADELARESYRRRQHGARAGHSSRPPRERRVPTACCGAPLRTNGRWTWSLPRSVDVPFARCEQNCASRMLPACSGSSSRLGAPVRAASPWRCQRETVCAGALRRNRG